TGVFQVMTPDECHFINGSGRVRFVERLIYKREQLAMLESDVGLFVGDTPSGEKQAQYLNSDPARLEYYRAAVDRHCRHNYEVSTPFLVERRGEPAPSVSISLMPSSSQRGPGRRLCSVLDF
ncbi:HB2J protein, partial [Pomatostomus ruficeps]|nr:HB2J protein [Pomatostomus ruficeps]